MDKRDSRCCCGRIFECLYCQVHGGTRHDHTDICSVHKMAGRRLPITLHPSIYKNECPKNEDHK